ncbi:MAG TPA: hypothetical protein VKY19_29860 [Ktedonosporobacter sp.]|nr:hypothetical protein [Ktedonosporobacter sp.]
MGKKRRRAHQPAQPQPVSTILFTLPTVRLLKDAICIFETMLPQNPANLPNVPFARAVTAALKTKLDQMLQLEDWNRETPFDYNEVHILYAAIRIYLIKLKSSQKEELALTCTVLCRQFSLMVESANVQTNEPTR